MSEQSKTCLDATHWAWCRCGATYPPGPTFEEIDRLYEATKAKSGDPLPTGGGA
jgi:hypothetical protein